MAGSTGQKIVISGDHQTEEEITGCRENMTNYNNDVRSSSEEECFVVDIDYLSLLGNERSDFISSSSSSSNSSSTTIHHFQRSLSRKGSSLSHQRGGKATQQTQKDATAATACGSSVGVGGGVVEVGADHHHHHESYSIKGASLMMTGTSNLNKQPSIIVVGGDGTGGVVGATTEGTGTDTATENINIINTKTVLKETVMVTPESSSSKWRKRYNIIKQRSPSSSFSNWMMDPKRILLFFATLSSMGTIILIYFTLSMSKLDGEDMVVSHSQPQ